MDCMVIVIPTFPQVVVQPMVHGNSWYHHPMVVYKNWKQISARNPCLEITPTPTAGCHQVKLELVSGARIHVASLGVPSPWTGEKLSVVEIVQRKVWNPGQWWFHTWLIPYTLSIPSMGRLYIYLHEWLSFMVNVGNYTSSMDDMGTVTYCILTNTDKKKQLFSNFWSFIWS